MDVYRPLPMKILLLNQCFYPDVVSSAQHLTDLAVALAARRHSVTVVASRHGYDNPAVRFSHRETWRGISIIRIPSLGLGKRTRCAPRAGFRQFLGKLSYYPLPPAAVRPGRGPHVAATHLVPRRGIRAWQGAKFIAWVMDLNPDEAVAAGWLRERSLFGAIAARHAAL